MNDIERWKLEDLIFSFGIIKPCQRIIFWLFESNLDLTTKLFQNNIF